MPTLLAFKLSVVALALPVALSLPYRQETARTAGPLRIVQGNDDGWWEASTRQLFSQMTAAGNDVILSAPLMNKSGSGCLDSPPTVPTTPGEYNSVPAGAPAIGYDPSNARINYVNSYPVTAAKYGLQVLSSQIWGAQADYLVAGPNVGSNLGLLTLGSGTVGVAAEGASEGIRSIAFSGADNNFKPYTSLTTGDPPHVYADLSLQILNAVIASDALPAGYFLNVNYGKPTASCPTADKFKIVFTKIYSLWLGTTCSDGSSIASETDVQQNDCYATISPVTSYKLGPSRATQADIYNKLRTKLNMVCYNGKSSALGDLEGVWNAIGNAIP